VGVEGLLVPEDQSLELAALVELERDVPDLRQCGYRDVHLLPWQEWATQEMTMKSFHDPLTGNIYEEGHAQGIVRGSSQMAPLLIHHIDIEFEHGDVGLGGVLLVSDRTELVKVPFTKVAAGEVLRTLIAHHGDRCLPGSHREPVQGVGGEGEVEGVHHHPWRDHGFHEEMVHPQDSSAAQLLCTVIVLCKNCELVHLVVIQGRRDHKLAPVHRSLRAHGSSGNHLATTGTKREGDRVRVRYERTDVHPLEGVDVELAGILPVQEDGMDDWQFRGRILPACPYGSILHEGGRWYADDHKSEKKNKTGKTAGFCSV